MKIEKREGKLWKLIIHPQGTPEQNWKYQS